MKLNNQDIVRSLYSEMKYGDIIFIGRSSKPSLAFNLAIISNNKIVGQALKGVFLSKGKKEISTDERNIINRYVTITHIKNLSEAVRNKEFDQEYLDNIVKNFISADETVSEMTILALQEISKI